MQSCSVKYLNGQDVRCFWHRKRSAIMTAIVFLNHILQEQRPAGCLRHDLEQRKCREKRFMYSVQATGLMNLKNFFSMQIILCLIHHLSSFVLAQRQKKQERVWDCGSIRNVLHRKDMISMIPVLREAVWVRQEHSGMKHFRKIRNFWIYSMAFTSILSASRTPMTWRQLLFQ